MQLIRRGVFLLSVLCTFAQLHLAWHPPDPIYRTDAAPEQAVDNHIAKLSDPCEPQLIGSGPVPDIDTPAEFQNFTTLFAAARIASTPLGYRLVGQALNASVYGKVFHGVYYLEQYDPALCADECNANVDCSSFNICKGYCYVF